jgi:2,3-bisphosphoglycerate-independent phosphoglycerate mutase
MAETPVFDRLWETYPHTTLKASGEAVGLPPGQMGNSEVGHLTIGSGRVLFQDLMRVNGAVETGEFFENAALVGAFERAKSRGGNVHLLGLVSYGGVHSHIDHLRALLELAKRQGMEDRTWIHAFTDGRDVSPTSAVSDLAELPTEKIATVIGRYYAMDRDQRWERTERALAALLHADEGATGSDPVSEVQRSYDEGVTDEFIEPIVLQGRPRIAENDAIIFFNFRPDRARQLTQKLLASGFDVTTMTRYRDDFDTPVGFEEQKVTDVLAEVLAEHGIRQLHAAETEKYAHVTYFFDGGHEEPYPGEERILVPSPRDVPSYDHKPEMSAAELADRFVEALESDGFGFAVLNFANPDMVGHTGSIPAAVTAVETVDRCLGRVLEAVEARGGVSLVTADHGNAETMFDEEGKPHTAHTSNPVPFVLTETNVSLVEDGELSDLAPTILALLGLEAPLQMTGKNLTFSPS